MIQIDDKQAELIAHRINKNKQVNNMINKDSENVNVSSTQTEEKNSRDDDLIEILKQQIEVLKKDKAEYVNQVNNLNSLLKQQQTLLSQQQSLQLQSNDKIKALEIEIQEIKDDTNKNEIDRFVNESDNKVDNFYKDLREDRSNKQSSFLSRLFKR